MSHKNACWCWWSSLFWELLHWWVVSYSIALWSSVVAFTSWDWPWDIHYFYNILFWFFFQFFYFYFFYLCLEIADDDIINPLYHLSGLNGFFSLAVTIRFWGIFLLWSSFLVIQNIIQTTQRITQRIQGQKTP